MNVRTLAEKYEQYVIDCRHWIHQHPETAWQEWETMEFIENELHKMGDIITGNTYEAFFPLIAVAIIYFAITWIIAVLLGIVRKKIDPKKRKNKNILKGVVR